MGKIGSWLDVDLGLKCPIRRQKRATVRGTRQRTKGERAHLATDLVLDYKCVPAGWCRLPGWTAWEPYNKLLEHVKGRDLASARARVRWQHEMRNIVSRCAIILAQGLRSLSIPNGQEYIAQVHRMTGARSTGTVGSALAVDARAEV